MTPRLRIASCQRGSARVISSVLKNSSSITLGWTSSMTCQEVDHPAGQGHDGLDRLLVPAVVEDDERRPVGRLPSVAVVLEHRLLRRLVQRDGDEADRRAEVALLAQDLRRAPDLLRAEWLERVAGDGADIGQRNGHEHSHGGPGWGRGQIGAR